MSKRRLIVLVGVAGSGKRSAIIEACRNADIAYRQKLVDPSQFDADELPSEQVHACVVNNLLFNNIDDVDKYVHQIKLRLFPHENVITFLPLSIGMFYVFLMLRGVTSKNREGSQNLGGAIANRFLRPC